MDWTSLFESLDLNNLIPDCYEKWKPFVKGGLAWFLGRLSEDRQKEILADQLELGPFVSASDRLEAVLRRCPTLHKLGQILARDKRLSPELRTSLQRLESLPPRMTVDQIRAILQRENIRLDGITLGEKPLAEASVAVVMPFTFTDAAKRQIDGVFKIVRPEAEKALEKELELWPELGKALEEICHNMNLPVLEFAGPLAEAALLVADEVRLDREQTHIRRAVELYRDFPEIALPELLPWCTSRVTAMTHIKGKPLAEALNDPTVSKSERRRIVEKLVDGLIARPFWMSETWAIFHGDPHGGNIFLDNQGRIVPLDWSLAVELPKNDRVAVLQLLMGGLRLDEQAILQSLKQLGLSSDDQKLRQTASWAIGHIRNGNFPGFDWCLAVLDHAVEFGGLRLRAELALFRKALFALLALVEDIAPQASSDAVVVGAGLTRLASEWPSRAFANPFTRQWGTHVSNVDLNSLFADMPLSVTRFWFGCWSDFLEKATPGTRSGTGSSEQHK
ncbi:MAG TPA: AarF/UbiB family protein [Candidatus Rifleibacterium sp.]|nr:AarF/UbiB family protein [Candidatus Rifleibacterium sp.]